MARIKLSKQGLSSVCMMALNHSRPRSLTDSSKRVNFYPTHGIIFKAWVNKIEADIVTGEKN